MSSKELMDTSDESDPQANVSVVEAVEPGGSGDPRFAMTPQKTPEQHVEDIVKATEKARAQMYPVPGKVENISIAKIDEDYQMVDVHLDDVIHKRICNFEFIDLSKLLQRNKGFKDNDQRMKIASRNGYTFLSPISEHEAIQVNTYNKWEKAFRIYSNVLTAKHPQKATEHLQYNHTIYTASMSYHWENVYA